MYGWCVLLRLLCGCKLSTKACWKACRSLFGCVRLMQLPAQGLELQQKNPPFKWSPQLLELQEWDQESTLRYLVSTGAFTLSSQKGVLITNQQSLDGISGSEYQGCDFFCFRFLCETEVLFIFIPVITVAVCIQVLLFIFRLISLGNVMGRKVQETTELGDFYGPLLRIQWGALPCSYLIMGLP